MRVVIADDAVLIRSGLLTVLKDAGIEVVGEACDAAELLHLVNVCTPDAAIIDIRMPPTHTDEGILAAREIRAEHPTVAVLVLSQYVESSYAMRLVEENPAAAGYLLKDRIAHASTLADALARVVAGECVVDPTIVTRLLARARRRSPLDALTAREREVLALMAEGRSNAAICHLLSLSPKTVETHVSRVFTKLGLLEQPDGHRRVLAVLTYLRQGKTS
jgi:DNA-binding NarL/FixJ family response regulator